MNIGQTVTIPTDRILHLDFVAERVNDFETQMVKELV
jgi:hypothetical protein